MTDIFSTKADCLSRMMVLNPFTHMSQYACVQRQQQLTGELSLSTSASETSILYLSACSQLVFTSKIMC